MGFKSSFEALNQIISHFTCCKLQVLTVYSDPGFVLFTFFF